MILIGGILFLVVLPLTLFYGHYHFYRSVEKEVNSMSHFTGKREALVTQKDLEALPEKLRDYLQKVGAIDSCKDCHVTFKQTGRIKTGQYKKWIDFTAMQYMTASTPNFIWSARSFPLFIRDKSINGKGEVKVSFFGLKDVAKSNGPNTDESSLARCLGELLFYPIGFLSEKISWEVLENGSLKATLNSNGTRAEGIFFYNADGLLCRFVSKRYMNETLEDFTGMAEDYKMMGKLFIPSKMRAIWNLKDGDFEYFNASIADYKIE